MNEEKSEKIYPIRTLHEFLSELNREWRSFKRGTMLSIVIISVLLVASVGVVYRIVRLGVEITDVVFVIVLGALLLYSLQAMVRQYRFFRKWGHRMALLVQLEEKLMSEKLGDENKPSQA